MGSSWTRVGSRNLDPWPSPVSRPRELTSPSAETTVLSVPWAEDLQRRTLQINAPDNAASHTHTRRRVERQRESKRERKVDGDRRRLLQTHREARGHKHCMCDSWARGDDNVVPFTVAAIAHLVGHERCSMATS